MEKKHRPFLRSALFLLVFSLLIAGSSWVVMPKSNAKASGMRNARAFGYLAEQPDTIDFVVIGDSETYSSISPMQLWKDYGYTGYVCGTPAQHMEDTYKALEKFCETQSPKLVILEANAMFRSSGFQEDVQRVFFREVEQTLPLIEYHDRWKNLSLQDFTGQIQYDWINPLKGFVPTYTSQPWKGGHGYMKKTDKAREVEEVNRHYFDKIAGLCREKGIRLLVANAPAPVNWNYQKHNAIQRLAKEYSLPYLDMNFSSQEMGIDWEQDSRDGGDHMNVYGAQKVTAFLGKYLAKEYKLPDHRKDPAYASWDQNLKQYEKTIHKGMTR